MSEGSPNGRRQKNASNYKGLVAVLAAGEPFHPGEPVCVFRAADPLVLEFLRGYAARAKRAGRPAEYLKTVAQFVNGVELWQAENPHLIPAPEDEP